MTSRHDAAQTTDEDILKAYESNPGGGLKGVSVATRTPLALVSRALKRMGVVSDPRALSGNEKGSSLAPLDRLTESQWAYVTGVFAAQKRGVYITNSSVRIYVTISDFARLDALSKLLAVGELNAFYTNGGKNVQYVYRVAKKEHVERLLSEMQARLPVAHPWVEKGLAVLRGWDQASKEGNND